MQQVGHQQQQQQQRHQHACPHPDVTSNACASTVLPRLLPDLRLALASLYSLPPISGEAACPAQRRPSPQQTHEFLMQIQSRNVRRKIVSIQQQHRDHQQHATAASGSTYTEEDSIETLHMGSSWLACLVLLLRTHQPHAASTATTTTTTTTSGHDEFEASSTERLFAAQTLLHRLRRVKMVEAVDVELEAWPDTCDKTWLLECYQNPSVDSLASTYQEWMAHYCGNQFCALVVQRHICDNLQSNNNNIQHPNNDEDRLKSEFTVLTLAAVAYLQACDSHTSEHDRTPILSTILSAVATAVFRLRYDLPSSYGNRNNGNHSEPALVTIIQQAFQVVWVTASTACATPNFEAWARALLLCLAILPDAVLGSPGGARGRLSVDPKSLCAASNDLRNIDTPLLTEILLGTTQLTSTSTSESSSSIQLWVLQTCTKWATLLPLTIPLLQLAIPLVNQFLIQPYHQDHHEPSKSQQQQQQSSAAALAFVIAVCEGGSWTTEQIVASKMGMTDHPMNQQQTKKKQSNRSKKRQKERIETNSTQTCVEEATAEKRLRGELACTVTIQCWLTLYPAVQAALTSAASSTSSQVEGEGPIGCMAACANVCLPHILRDPSPLGRELFLNIAPVVQQMCASLDKTIRALALEPLYTLHSTLLEVIQSTGPLERELESIVVEHFFQCTMSIASVCGYPPHYFDSLGTESDEELEIERNDVRDLLRTVAGSGEGGSTVNTDSSEVPVETATRILARLVNACREAVTAAHAQPEAFPEPAVHALSSLAKPLNHLSKCYATHGGSEDVRNILGSVLQALIEMNLLAVTGFQQSLAFSPMLPMSRIVNIANASLAPFLCALASLEDEAIAIGVERVLDFAIQGSILSLEQLPELCAPSILGYSHYNIRGSMGGPGGEDHVGCLTLMRFCFEDEALGQKMVLASARYMSRLCELHQTLKTIEVERGKGVLHGRGVCPQTRRILVGTLCHMELRSNGQLGASDMLSGLVKATITAIARFRSKSDYSEGDFFVMTESTLDLASFSSTIVASLFQSCTAWDPNDGRTDCLEVLTNAYVNGYQHMSTAMPDPSIAQWTRLRAAMFLLLRKASVADLSERSAAIITACVAAECEAIHRQCAAGPESTSSIFTDDIMSSDSNEGIPAGLFVRCIAEVLQSSRKNSRGHHVTEAPVSIEALDAAKAAVLSAITLPCPAPRRGAFIDPRPTVCEAWLQAMIEVAELKSENPVAQSLLIETCVTMVSLLFVPSMGRSQSERLNDNCMSFDGPHSLALTMFLSAFFRLGHVGLKAVGQRLLSSVPVDVPALQHICGDSSFHGVSVVGAALFRACQGALPPWAVESVPEVYSSLFEACGNDVEGFGLLMRLSMEVRLSSSHNVEYWGVGPGKLLSGRFFESLSDKARATFISQTMEICAKGGMASWKNLKVLIKQVCGGKKRDTEFNQKPAITRWEFQRV